MKYLNSITLIQFKNYASRTFDFPQKCIAITGRNGSGKTNLLDAIYYLCFTKSYFNKKEKNNIQYSKDGFRITGVFSEGEEKYEVSCLFRDNKKSISLNDARYEKISSHIGFQTAVIIAPDDISIINGYSEDRRKFFDGLLSQMDNHYLAQLLAYQKILHQKNTYLRTAYPLSRELIDVYNEQLLAAGEYIIRRRKEFTKLFSPSIEAFYSAISGRSESIQCNYTPDCEQDSWREQQQKVLESELMQKRTLIGPHADDWDFLIEDMPLKSNGSQGQKKTFLIALKLSQVYSLNREDKAPILLLDDIFEKLDRQRLDDFFKTLLTLQISQVFLTHTDEEQVDQIVKKHYIDIGLIKLIR